MRRACQEVLFNFIVDKTVLSTFFVSNNELGGMANADVIARMHRILDAYERGEMLPTDVERAFSTRWC